LKYNSSKGVAIPLARMALFLLGPPRIEYSGEPVEIDRHKAIALLAYLAVTGERQSRDALATLLWPEDDQSKGRAALRRALSTLHKILPGNWWDVDRETIGLQPGPGLWLDLDQFHDRIAKCQTHGHPAADACPDCVSPLTEAASLYRGDFLVGFTLRDSPGFDDWQFFQTESLRREQASVLERLARVHGTQGELEPAIGYARRWLALDPLHEEAHRQLMNLYAWSGQRNAALRQYEECARILERELGVSPQEATVQLYEAIKENRASAQSSDRWLLTAGTVTFLMTDVEGSTRLWERYPAAIAQALGQHDALIEGSVGRHGGTVVQPRGEGDSRFAVFSRASDAVAAASAIQQAFLAEAWPAPEQLRVRIALHTGEGEWHGIQFYGTAVNRCARLRAVAHGGQTLLSETTHDLVRGALLEGVTFRDLGAHRLRDLEQPEHIFELLHPALSADFPPLKPLDTLPHNLPSQLTSFIGRETEMAEVKRLLAPASRDARTMEGTGLRARQVTLTGVGGTGKTRLALAVAADMLVVFPDGVWLIELASVSNPALVPQTVAAPLGMREEPGRPLLATLMSYLRVKNLLLILDNCEHLIEACAQLAEILLRDCPDVKILATSRQPLCIAGEICYQVPSLSLPDADQMSAVVTLKESEAVRLFVDRAETSLPGFVVTDRNAPAVVQVCRRLDGIPLAIELAAARVKMLKVEQIVSRLDDRFRLLTGGSRAALPRHQTLSALIDWSYDLLSESECVLLRRLSVFRGGWTLEAAEKVTSDQPEVPSDRPLVTRHPPLGTSDVLDVLTQLVNKSLVVAAREQGEVARYRMLETIREYAWEKLVEAGEPELVQKRHLSFFLKLAEEAEPKLHSTEQMAWLDRLESEHDNLRAALEWSQANGESEEKRLRLAGALFWFWYIRNYVSEGRSWLEEALARGSASDRTLARANALYAAGGLGYKQVDFRARVQLEESIAILRDAGPLGRRGLAYALMMLGALAQYYGDIAQLSHFQESMVSFRELDDKWGLALTLNWTGAATDPTHPDNYSAGPGLSRQGSDLVIEVLSGATAARPLYEESLSLLRELGDRWAQTMPLGSLGNSAFCQGEGARGRALFEENLAIQREFGDKLGVAWSLWALANEALDQEDHGRAAALFQESLAIYQALEVKLAIATSFSNLGELARRRGDYRQATELQEESLILRRELGNRERIAFSLDGLGRVAWSQHYYESARLLQAEALAIRQESGNPISLAHSLEAFAVLAAAQGQPGRAARLFGAVGPFLEPLCYSVLPIWRAEYERSLGAVRTQLSEAAFAAAWGEGRAMTLEQAIGFATVLMDA